MRRDCGEEDKGWVEKHAGLEGVGLLARINSRKSPAHEMARTCRIVYIFFYMRSTTPSLVTYLWNSNERHDCKKSMCAWLQVIQCQTQCKPSDPPAVAILSRRTNQFYFPSLQPPAMRIELAHHSHRDVEQAYQSREPIDLLYVAACQHLELASERERFF